MLKTVRSAEMPFKRSAFGGAVLFSALFASSLLRAEVTAVSVKGQVYLKGTGSVVWGEITDNRIVNSGDEIRTAGGSKATLSFKDGSRVELGPKSTFMLEKTGEKEASMKLSVGWMKAVVSRVMARRFSVRTPTAVCSVRGTEFDLSVKDSGATAVSLFTGSLGVADGKGNEVTLKPGESVNVDQQGIGKVAASPTQESKKAEDTADRKALKREVGLEMTKEEVQAAAALEQKNAVYQQGKAMVDVNGYRVRLEEYIIRPTPTQFKLVVLNERADRFDYFYYLGTFNRTLPDDISGALRQIPGCIGAACSYWLSSYETGRSNTQDRVLESASGGHLVDVNNNGVAGDEITMAFNTQTNDYQNLTAAAVDNAGNLAAPANDKFFVALFDDYTLAYNGINHIKWVPTVAAYNASAGGCVGGVGTACLGIQSEGASAGSATDQRTWSSGSTYTSLIKPPNCANADCVISDAVNAAIAANQSPVCDNLDDCSGFRDQGKLHQISTPRTRRGPVGISGQLHHLR